jgi:histidyl-tRNA synthetase
MIDFESNYFQKLKFEGSQVKRFFIAARKDLKIASESNQPEVIFKFSYDALIKLGITLIALKGYRVRSIVGHHVKMIEKVSQILKNKNIAVYSNQMRKIRNLDFYDGGFLITEKQAKDFLRFVENVFKQAGKSFDF